MWIFKITTTIVAQVRKKALIHEVGYDTELLYSGVQYYWGFGTGLSVVIMAGAIAYITYQYCTQSHLSSEDYDQAMQGLRTTRWFKRRTMWIRNLLERVIRLFKRLLPVIFGTKVNPHPRSLVWTPKAKIPRLSTATALNQTLNQQRSQISEPPSVQHLERSSASGRYLQPSSSRDE